MIIRLLLPLLFVLLLGSAASAGCPRYQAPGQFNYPPTWGVNSGVVIDGFVDVRKKASGLYNVLHGVDLSRFNTAKYTELSECGGTFAFVQLDQSWNTHYSGVRSQNAVVIPYYFLKLPAPLRNVSSFDRDLAATEIAEYRRIYAEAGARSGRDFISKIGPVIKAAGDSVNISGLAGRFVALDVEQSPTTKPVSAAQQKYFGRFYAVALCAWIKTVKTESKYSDLIPILYTFPAIYSDYLQYAYPEETNCLQGLPIWIARTTLDAGEASSPSNRPNVDKMVQRMCRIQSGNRCIIHQYSHRGTFIATGKSVKGIPPTVDLNRFYLAKPVKNGVGIQYVRVEDSH